MKVKLHLLAVLAVLAVLAQKNALEEFVRLECAREFETCTSRLQTWNQPRKRKLDSQLVYEIDFSKKSYRSL